MRERRERKKRLKVTIFLLCLEMQITENENGKTEDEKKETARRRKICCLTDREPAIAAETTSLTFVMRSRLTAFLL